MELARLLSMFFVLMIHANMVSLPIPTSSDLECNALPTIFRCFIESLGVVSVNVFVLISGWFSIKTTPKRVLAFLFQVFFFWGGAYLILVISGHAHLTLSGLSGCLAFTKWEFFIKAYLFLFILAPILNTYVSNSSEFVQRRILFCFFIYAFTYGWIGGASRFFVNGYGPLFFIGLYLLAQYAHNTSLHPTTPGFVKKLLSQNKSLDLFIYFLLCSVNAFIYVLTIKYKPYYFDYVISFVNPLVVFAALYFLLFCSKLRFKNNRFVNWISISSFAVYLLHSQINLRSYFTKSIQYLYDLNNGLICVGSIFCFLVILYFVSVLVDKVRIFVWNHLCVTFGSCK